MFALFLLFIFIVGIIIAAHTRKGVTDGMVTAAQGCAVGSIILYFVIFGLVGLVIFVAIIIAMFN